MRCSCPGETYRVRSAGKSLHWPSKRWGGQGAERRLTVGREGESCWPYPEVNFAEWVTNSIDVVLKAPSSGEEATDAPKDILRCVQIRAKEDRATPRSRWRSPTCFIGAIVGGRTLGWKNCGLSNVSGFVVLTCWLVPTRSWILHLGDTLVSSPCPLAWCLYPKLNVHLTPTFGPSPGLLLLHELWRNSSRHPFGNELSVLLRQRVLHAQCPGRLPDVGRHLPGAALRAL